MTTAASSVVEVPPPAAIVADLSPLATEEVAEEGVSLHSVCKYCSERKNIILLVKKLRAFMQTTNKFINKNGKFKCKTNFLNIVKSYKYKIYDLKIERYQKRFLNRN